MAYYITVYSKNDIRVTFKDGTEIKYNPIDAETPLNHIGSEALL